MSAKKLIPAATILILRDEPTFQVLMIERHANIEFAGGALVFPGGRIDDADADPGWVDYTNGTANQSEEMHAARIAAIREAFEETGILLARDRSGNPVLPSLVEALDGRRSEIEKDATAFQAMIREEDLRLALDDLTLYARWVPPSHSQHKRFDTMFFAARMPEGQQAREDGNEATEALWIAPHAALAACDQGERKLIFPTYRNLELLGVTEDVEATLQFASKRKIETVQPIIEQRDGEPYIVIPHDLGYPVSAESVKSAQKILVS